VRILAAALAVTLPAAATAGDAALGRLGRDVVPVSQSIALDLDPRAPDYTGSVDVVVDVRTTVRSIRFHAEQIELTALSLARTGAAGAARPLTASPLPDGQVEAKAEGAIAPGRYTLHADFKNNFDTEAKGLYRLQVAGDWYAFSQFEAVDAREAFPCWDEPGFKIPYTITLTVPSEHVAIANTLEDRITEKDGKRTVTFKPTRPLPSYLLAVATGPLELVSVPGTSIATRIATTQGQSRLAGTAAAVTPAILKALERYFASRYPYDKLDLIAVPEYWYGAMENPGAITFVDRVLLHDPAATTDDARENLVVDVAHELAHMWFGDLVTMAWWDDLWLNESFATWMEDKITAETHPEFNSVVGEVKSAQRVMELDSRLTTRAMRQPVRSVDSLLQSADALAYSKGSAVLHMVEAWIGPEAFRSGVLAYLKAHADANATGDDLWNALSRASGKGVKRMLRSFLDQPGVPLVAVEPLSGGRVKLTQARFLNAGAHGPPDALWEIPVSLRYPVPGGLATERFLLKNRSRVVRLSVKATPAWIHPNADEVGYYRWSLPAELMTRLAAAAPGALVARERVGFLGNAQALLGAGRLGGAEYVRLLESFASDPDPEVIGNVLDGLDKIRETFFDEGHEAEFAPFVRRTLGPVLNRIGTERAPGEPETITVLRPRLLEALGDAGRDDAVLAKMESLAAAAVAGGEGAETSLADTAVHLSAIRGDPALFDLYRRRFESAQVPAERRRYLRALGNFRSPELSARALDYVFTGPLRPQELLSIPRSQAQIPSARAATFAWVKAHYDRLAARIPADFLVFLPAFADGCSADRVEEAKAFFADPKHAPAGTATEMARVEESVGDCVGVSAREGDSVRRYTTSER
jgi:alanyl aminopeptidase